MADQIIRIVAAGNRYDIDLADFTARDAGDFRKAVGVSLADSIGNGQADLDVIAGLVWLVRRGTDRRLSYHSVAETLNYGNVEAVGEDDEAERGEEDLSDPQP